MIYDIYNHSHVFIVIVGICMYIPAASHAVPFATWSSYFGLVIFLSWSTFFVGPTFLGRKYPCAAARFFSHLHHGNVSWMDHHGIWFVVIYWRLIQYRPLVTLTSIDQQEQCRKTICNNKANHMCCYHGSPTSHMPLPRLVRIPSWLLAAASAVLETHMKQS